MSEIIIEGDVLLHEVTEFVEPVRGLRPGDILHIQLGIPDTGNGIPWIPSVEELTDAEERWTAKVPEGVFVYATHFGEVVEVLRVEPEDADE